MVGCVGWFAVCGYVRLRGWGLGVEGPREKAGVTWLSPVLDVVESIIRSIRQTGWSVGWILVHEVQRKLEYRDC